MNTKPKILIPKDTLTIILSAIVIVLLTFYCYIMKYSLIVPVFLLFLGIHLNYFNKARIKVFLHLGLLLALIIFASHIIIEYTQIPYYYIPVAAIAMLTTLLFNDLQLSFAVSFASSVLVSSIVGGDFNMLLIFFLGSLTGSYCVYDARTRGHLINAGLLVGGVHVLCLALLNPDWHLLLNKTYLTFHLYPLVFNGFICSLFVSATLKVFEMLFGVLTNFSLLELSDFNQPLLRRLILEAPGTYHHSLIVSNLAEAAAESIGANGLLTRVGAYYHDIGKLVKSEYFVENQQFGDNKHDFIEPTMSRLVVLNHVKEGIELGKKYHLNPVILDFIPQHHGTSLMHYFHQKALAEAQEGEEVDEEQFRYPGPKPQIRETAIVLLADSVEGATRALDEHTPARIEETVKKVINNKFIDGQLDESALSLKDIETISKTFIRILNAMYHGRVKYPEKKNGNHNRRPSEKDQDHPTAG